jgi:rhodanese-related sulfurtransferase
VNKLIITALLFVGTASMAMSNSQGNSQGNTQSKAAAKAEDFHLIHVAELQQAMEMNKEQVYVYDANTKETREKQGLIPGAHLLASVTDYDTKVLPADKSAKLVFYCANTQCMASHEAAKRAVAAGYKNVNVMADGIDGWIKAGKKTEKSIKTI